MLILHRIKRSQMGNYLCIASNNYPPAVSRTVKLKVNCEFLPYLYKEMLSKCFLLLQSGR